MKNISTRMKELIARSNLGELEALLKDWRDNAALIEELPFHDLASNTKHNKTELFEEIIELLLEFKFDINARNEDGKTALHVAVFEYKNLPVAVPLMKNGGDFNGVSLDQMDELEKLGISLATPMWLRRDSETETMHRGGLHRILEIRFQNPAGFDPPYSNLEEISWEKLRPWLQPDAPQQSSPFWFLLEQINTGEIIEANHSYDKYQGFGWEGILKVGDKIYKHWETKKNQ